MENKGGFTMKNCYDTGVIQTSGYTQASHKNNHFRLFLKVHCSVNRSAITLSIKTEVTVLFGIGHSSRLPGIGNVNAVAAGTKIIRILSHILSWSHPKSSASKLLRNSKIVTQRKEFVERAGEVFDVQVSRHPTEISDQSVWDVKFKRRRANF